MSMDGEAFFKVKKDYKDEHDRIKRKTTMRERLVKIIWPMKLKKNSKS